VPLSPICSVCSPLSTHSRPTAASHVAFGVRNRDVCRKMAGFSNGWLIGTTGQLRSLEQWPQQSPPVCFSRTSPQPRLQAVLWHVSAWDLLNLTPCSCEPKQHTPSHPDA
jgi:hypothetical protein